MATDIESKIRTMLPKLSKGHRLIARAILDGYDRAAYMTAAELGELAGVSESTVVRFAGELGFPGYPALQHAVQEMVRTRLTPNQRMAVSDSRMGHGDLLASAMEGDMARIRYTLEHIDRAAFNAAVETLLGARHIYTIGMRSSASLASFLHFNLSLIVDNTTALLPGGPGEVFEQMLNIGAEDALIAVSFPRYTNEVVHAVRYAQHRGAAIIALTDSDIAPISEYATHLLTAQSDMVSFVDSLVAPLSVINAMVMALANRMRDKVTERFDRLEQIWDAYDVYAKKK